MKNQLMRASLSIVLNLVEGSSRATPKDRRRFYGIAYGSARETKAILHLISNQRLYDLSDQICACLYRLKQMPVSVNGDSLP
jgi:four helix bundle protein